MRAHLSSRIAVLCLLAAGAACSSSSKEGATSSTNALVINPIGTEDDSDIVLQLPTDACSPGATCAKILGAAPSISIDGVSVALGASTRLRVGSHTLALNNVGSDFSTTAGEHLTVTLPVANTVCTDATLPNVPATDFGGSISVSNAACPTTATGSIDGVPASTGFLYDYSTCASTYVLGSIATYNCSTTAGYNFYYLNSAGTCVYAGNGPSGCSAAEAANPRGTTPLTSSYQAYPPGTLTATVNGTAQTLTLNPGDETTFNISLPALGTVPATFATDITFLDPRANPDAKTSTITSSCSGDRTYTFPAPGSSSLTSLNLNAFANSACTYTLNVGGRTQTLTQTATNSVSVHRLDVNNVTITREDLDGGTYPVTGQWTLNYGGVQVAGPFNTGTGVDVLSGTYEFSLTYTDFDGTQTQTQTLTF
jgi:hypothetical protein